MGENFGADLLEQGQRPISSAQLSESALESTGLKWHQLSARDFEKKCAKHPSLNVLGLPITSYVIELDADVI